MPDFLANEPLIINRELHFMHDRAPPHFTFHFLQVPESKVSWSVDKQRQSVSVIARP
jgi:hypothetical protein